MVAAPHAAADPNIDDVRERVDRLETKTKQATRLHQDARVRLNATQERLLDVESDLEERQSQVQQLRDHVTEAVVSYYEGGRLSTASQTVLGDDPDVYLGQLTTISEYTADRSDQIEQLAAEVEELEALKASLEERLDAAAEQRSARADERRGVEKKAAEARKLLDRLKREAAEARAEARAEAAAAAAERAERESRSETREPAPAAPAVSGGAAAAVSYALAQVGDAYSYGSTGPDAFDCSGLTGAAWAAAGVSLPRTSSAQMGAGTPVSFDALQPGDLVFYYSPVSHVGIYIGNGQIVHAANPSTGVQVTSVSSMPYSGAVRPG